MRWQCKLEFRWLLYSKNRAADAFFVMPKTISVAIVYCYIEAYYGSKPISTYFALLLQQRYHYQSAIRSTNRRSSTLPTNNWTKKIDIANAVRDISDPYTYICTWVLYNAHTFTIVFIQNKIITTWYSSWCYDMLELHFRAFNSVILYIIG